MQSSTYRTRELMQVWKRITFMHEPYNVLKLNGKPQVLQRYKTGSYVFSWVS